MPQPRRATRRIASRAARWLGALLAAGLTGWGVLALGRIDQSLPFLELQRRSLANAAAQAADQAPDFSRRIRHELPGPAAAPR